MAEPGSVLDVVLGHIIDEIRIKDFALSMIVDMLGKAESAQK